MQLTRTQRRDDTVVALVCLALGLAAIWESRSFPEAAGGYPGPGMFPTFVGAVFAVCGLLLLARVLLSLRRTRAPEDGSTTWEEAAERPTRRALLNAAAILLAVPVYVFLSDVLGFFLTVALVVGGLMVLLGTQVLRVAVPVALGVAGFVWYVFGEILLVPLPSAIWEG